MTTIVIDDVENIHDLTDAIAAVLNAFKDPSRYADPEAYFSKGGPTPLRPELEAPKPYLPCPRRRTHLRLTDCWACWSDVRRGACLEVDVLSPQVWDTAIGELVAAETAWGPDTYLESDGAPAQAPDPDSGRYGG